MHQSKFNPLLDSLGPAQAQLFAANEPLYRITVALSSQTALAYGEAVALHPGMQVEADILIENRRLIEWMFDPLFTLTGKWR